MNKACRRCRRKVSDPSKCFGGDGKIEKGEAKYRIQEHFEYGNIMVSNICKEMEAY